jgi:iron complex transport system substrate-binding protein
VDTDLVRALHPDLVLAGGLPQGGSAGEADSPTLERVLGRDVSVVRLQPRSVEGILNSIATVGAFCEAEDEAIGLIEILRERLGTIENRILERRLEGVPSRRAVVLGWLDPPVAVGRWVPEMVRRAGGWELLGTEGETATTVAWERLRDVEPELVVLAFEGHDAAQAARRLGTARLPRWFDGLEAVRDGELFAVDGGLYWRPGPRVIDGIALLAELLDPEAFAGAGPTEAWIPLGPVGIGVGPAPA